MYTRNVHAVIYRVEESGKTIYGPEIGRIFSSYRKAANYICNELFGGKIVTFDKTTCEYTTCSSEQKQIAYINRFELE